MTKERLMNYRALIQEENQLRDQIRTVEGRLYAPRSPRLTGMPKSGGDRDPQLGLMENHGKLLEIYHSKLKEIEAETMAIEKAIEELKPREKILLRFRYIDGLKWEEICVKMSYSWQMVHKIHRTALRLLADKPEKE